MEAHALIAKTQNVFRVLVQINVQLVKQGRLQILQGHVTPVLVANGQQMAKPVQAVVRTV